MAQKRLGRFDAELIDGRSASSERDQVTHDENGVDLPLIDAILGMSVEERLRLNDRTIASIHALRAAFAGGPLRLGKDQQP